MSNRSAMLRNVTLVAFASYVESAVGLLAGIVIARTLGPAEYGQYAYGVWLCGVLLITINSSLTTSSIKFLAELRGAQEVELAHVLVFKLQRWQTMASILVLSCFVIGGLLTPVKAWQASPHIMLALSVVAVWARAGFWLQGAVGKGFELFGPENITLAATAMLNLIVTLTLAWLGAGVLEYFASYAALGVASNLTVRYLIRRGGVKAQPGTLPKPLFERVRKHLFFTGILIGFGVLTNRVVEMNLLKQYHGPTAVAYFAIAGSLSKGIVDLLVGGLAAVLLPSMARQYGQGGSKALARVLAESTRLYWFIGLAIGGLGFTAAEGAIRVLYGTRYVEAIPALTWQLLVSGLCVINGGAAAALTTDDRQLERIMIVASSFAVNVVLGFWAVPHYGLSGAILCTSVTQLMTVGLTWWVAYRRTKVQLLLGPMSRLLMAAVLSAAVASTFTHVLNWAWGFVPGGMIFAVLYVVLSVVLRTWRATDFDMFSTIASHAGNGGKRLAPWLTSLGPRFGVASQ